MINFLKRNINRLNDYVCHRRVTTRYLNLTLKKQNTVQLIYVIDGQVSRVIDVKPVIILGIITIYIYIYKSKINNTCLLLDDIDEWMST